MKIPLKAWAAKQFDPVPCIRTLRDLANNGRIDPAPVRVGRSIMVEHDAVLLAAPVVDVPAWASGRVAEILRAA